MCSLAAEPERLSQALRLDDMLLYMLTMFPFVIFDFFSIEPLFKVLLRFEISFSFLSPGKDRTAVTMSYRQTTLEWHTKPELDGNKILKSWITCLIQSCKRCHPKTKLPETIKITRINSKQELNETNTSKCQNMARHHQPEESAHSSHSNMSRNINISGGKKLFLY